MFSVDIYWIHLILVPLLWGIFIPIIAFKVSRELGGNEKISALSSLVVSLFPANIIWGAVSIPNGLSYIFFFCLLYFLLRYMKSNRARDLFLIAAFFFASLLSHVLAGTVALSLFFLAYSIKVYQKEKGNSPVSARLTLLTTFIFSVSLLPFALVLRKYFYPSANTYFSLEKIYQLTPMQTLFSLLFGSYFEFISREAYMTALIRGMAPLIGLIGIIVYILRTSGKKVHRRSVDPRILFLFLGFLVIVVDDRIVKYFMANPPFLEAERLWLFRDFLLVSFLALVIGSSIQEMDSFFRRLSGKIVSFIQKTRFMHPFSKAFPSFKHSHLVGVEGLTSFLAYILVLTAVSGWVTASVYYSYPHWAPLQTTPYEIEAVKFIEQNTTERYIVICDQWIIFAGQMFVGIYNPQSHYFSYADPHGVALFIKMKANPSPEILIEAMKCNNSTIAYFVIAKLRQGADEYNRIIRQARQNGLQTYPDGIFYYEGEEKLRIFYSREHHSTVSREPQTKASIFTLNY